MSKRRCDSWRGLFSLLVLIAHTIQAFSLENGLFFGGWGWLARAAVLGFFVLSGYAIQSSIRSNLDNNAHFSGAVYFKHRVIRVFPALILSSFLCWLISHFFYATCGDFCDKVARLDLKYDVYHAVMSLATFGILGDLTGKMNGPLWTLAIELQCYLLLFLIWKSMLFIGVFKKFLMVILSLFVIYKIFFPICILNIICISGFFLGALMCIYCHGRFLPMVKSCGLIAVLLSLLLYFSISNLIGMVDDFNSVSVVAIHFLIILLFLGFIFIGVEIGGGMRDVADISYELYVVHFPVILFVSYKFFENKSNNILLYLMISWTIAFFLALVFRCIFLWFEKWKKYSILDMVFGRQYL